MKKTFICTALIAAGALSLFSINNGISYKTPEFALKNYYSALTLGYDKSMSEKTIKAAVIDSYFRELVANGKLIRWLQRSCHECFSNLAESK